VFTYSADYFDYSAHFDAIALDVQVDADSTGFPVVPVLGFEQGKNGAPIAFLSPVSADAWAALIAEHVDHVDPTAATDDGAVGYLGGTVEPFTDAHGVSHYAYVVEFLPNTDAASWSPVRFGL
jgi:hypothetical protein